MPNLIIYAFQHIKYQNVTEMLKYDDKKIKHLMVNTGTTKPCMFLF